MSRFSRGVLGVEEKGHRGSKASLIGRKPLECLRGGVKGPVGIAQGLEQVLSNEGSNDS